MAEYTAKYLTESGVFRRGEFKTVKAAREFLEGVEDATSRQVLNSKGETVWHHDPGVSDDE